MDSLNLLIEQKGRLKGLNDLCDWLKPHITRWSQRDYNIAPGEFNQFLVELVEAIQHEMHPHG